MTPGQITAIADRLDAIDKRLAKIERARAIELEVADRAARARDGDLRRWSRRASIAAVISPLFTLIAAGIAVASHT